MMNLKKTLVQKKKLSSPLTRISQKAFSSRLTQTKNFQMGLHNYPKNNIISPKSLSFSNSVQNFSSKKNIICPTRKSIQQPPQFLNQSKLPRSFDSFLSQKQPITSNSKNPEIIVPKSNFTTNDFADARKGKIAEYFKPSNEVLKGKKRGAPPMLDSKKIVKDESGVSHVPLTLQYPGTPSSTVIYEDPKTAKSSNFGEATVEVTTLPNGVRIATDNSPSPTISMAFFLDVGTIYETDETHGMCHMLERLAFKGTKNRPASQLVQELEHTGGNITASSSREQIFYSADVIGEHLEKTFEVLCDVILNPKFNPQDVEEEQEYIATETSEALQNVAGLIPESLHRIAFGESPLARSLLSKPEVLKNLSPDVIRAFHRKFYRPERMVVSFAGIGHQEALSLAQRYLHFPAELTQPTTEVIAYPHSVYVGGEERTIHDHSLSEESREYAFYGLAFEGYGHKNLEAAAPVFTLQSLFGGGGAFSAGGPGKGMYTRFYRNVVCSDANVENLETTHNSYLNTGLFSIHVAVEHGSIMDSLSIICQELVSAALYMTDEEFFRAKKQLKSNYFGSLENQNLICDDLGRQVLETGAKTQTPERVCEYLDNLQKPELQTFLKDMLLRSPPTFFYTGRESELKNIPEASVVVDYFKEHLAN